MKRVIVFLIWLICFSCQNKKELPKSIESDLTPLLDSLSSQVKRLYEPGYINGYGVALVNEDGILFAEGVGFADKASGRPYTSKTIQNIGSVSKTFIGLCLMKAVEQEKITLDDPINHYLPFEVNNPTHPDQPITIRHLATHTSTIRDTEHYDGQAYILKNQIEDSSEFGEIPETFHPPESKMTMIEFLKELLTENGQWYLENGFTEHRPGEIYEYSNVGATLAAAVLEQATAKSFNDFCSEHILKPLGMSYSGWSFENIDMSTHSTLYANPETKLPYYSLITYPDGGLITSVSDLGLYLSELIKGYNGNGNLLTRESYKELFTEQLQAENLPDRDEEDDFDDEYNTGIFMGFSPKGYVGHIGGDPGIATFMFFNPATSIGRIMSINTSVINSEGVDQFYSVWNKLGEFETVLQNATKSHSIK